MRSRCLQCQYPREGLAPDTACPECGEPAPPADWIVLHGRSAPSNPRWRFVGFAALLVGAGTMAFTAWRTRQHFLYVHAIGLLSVGSYFAWRTVRLLRHEGDGGDLSWVLKPESVVLRGAFGAREFPYSHFEFALYERGWAAHYVCLSLAVRSPVDSQMPLGIWLDTREHDTRALHQLLRERLLRFAPLNPPAAPPPGPS